ncbi:MAG: 6-pyruvoyl-tetrahydropterin synthase-related protein [Acidobacteriaceae bacterium]
MKSSSQLRSLLIALTALLAVGTLVVRGNTCGHDFDFHLLSWMEVVRSWHAGLMYPHWVQDANFGAGEPRLIFYPPVSWLLGGLLGSIVGWHAAPVVFVLLALLGAGISMYLLAREWAPPDAATLAACLYIASPYAMFVAYERSALGELLASAWLPLMVLFALRRRSSIAALSLTVAALWLTNSPAAVIGSYLLAVLALAMWIAEGRPWPALRAAGGMALGLGLAAFYIVPAAFEQRWVQINRAINPGMRVEDSFLFAHTANPFHDQVLRTASWIFLAELAVASLFAYLAWKKQTGGRARIAITASLPVILLLQLPVSDVIWKHTPHMKFLQFPWRWLVALSLVVCVLAGMTLDKLRPKASWCLLLIVAAMAIGGGLLFFQPCDDEDAVTAQVAGFRTGQGTQGTDEYTPVGVDSGSVQQDLPMVRVLRAPEDDTADSAKGDNPDWRAGDPGSITAKADARRWNGEHWLFNVVTPETGYAVLRLMDYPAWRVTVDGKPAQDRPGRGDGLMAVPVTAGSHAIEVQWSASSDVIAGREISAIALLALVLVAVLERRERRV